MAKTIMSSYMSQAEQTRLFDKADRERGIVRRGVLNRKVSAYLRSGKVVYRYTGYTGGIIGKRGVAVTDRAGKKPFYEVPKSAVDWEGK